MKLDKTVLFRILSIAAVAVITLSVFFVIRLNNNDNITYSKIVSYVSGNYEKLENFPYSEIEKIKSSNDSPEIKNKRKKK